MSREYLIWSIEHGAWWRPAKCGYTQTLSEAGRYSFVDATDILTRANYVRVNECTIPAECVRRDDQACINCQRYFTPKATRYYFGAGAKDVGPFCDACDRTIKVHVGFKPIET